VVEEDGVVAVAVAVAVVVVVVLQPRYNE